LLEPGAIIDDTPKLTSMVASIFGCTGNTGEAKVTPATVFVVERTEQFSPGMGTTNIDGPALGFSMSQSLFYFGFRVFVPSHSLNLVSCRQVVK
jgi:hypothetical protein